MTPFPNLICKNLGKNKNMSAGMSSLRRNVVRKPVNLTKVGMANHKVRGTKLEVVGAPHQSVWETPPPPYGAVVVDVLWVIATVCSVFRRWMRCWRSSLRKVRTSKVCRRAVSLFCNYPGTPASTGTWASFLERLWFTLTTLNSIVEIPIPLTPSTIRMHQDSSNS